MPNGPYHQSVPRPADSVPGLPPPWAERHRQGLGSVSLEVLRTALEPLEGLGDREASISSAVLIPVLEVDGEAIVVLTRRSSDLVRDPGNVSFPGGRLEPGEHPRDGALRETEEEIGLSRDDVEVIGALPLVRRRRDEELVASYVGILARPPAFVANADEVEEIIEVPLAGLLADGVAWEETWGSGDQARPVRFFASASFLGADLVWGLTAGILWDLLDKVSLVLEKTETGLDYRDRAPLSGADREDPQ